MWYKFEEGNPIGIPRVKKYQVAWYDMGHKGDCFDESFYTPNEIDAVMPFIETVEDVNNSDRSRVFVHFDNGDVYELKLELLNSNKRYSNFDD